MGILTIAVVTKPFSFEGQQRKKLQIRRMKIITKCETIITIPNERVLQIIDKKTSLLEL
jgi:cell division protein FtsZ